MATNEQIVKYLLGGGSYKELTKGGLTQKQILAAIFSSPKNLKSIQDYVSGEVKPYETYDATKAYDTDTPNQVRAKYEMYGPTYRTLVDDFFNTVDNAGGNQTKVDAFVNDLNSRMDEASAHYGIPKDELSTTLAGLQKDTKKYVTQHQKNQFAAFQKQRKAKGISSGETAKQDYMKKLTGVGGLADVSTTLEDLAKKRAAAWAAKRYGENVGSEQAKAQIADYEKSFMETAKKKKRGALHYGAKEILNTLTEQ